MNERLIVGLMAAALVASIVVGVIVAVRAPAVEGAGGIGSRRHGYAVVDLVNSIDAHTASEVAARLQTLGKNRRVKAVVVRVNSPGGSVAATQEMHREVQRLTQKGVPVVVSVADVGASGAYYVACGAGRIFADKGSIVGSIGVISIFPNLEVLFGDKLGIKTKVLTSGKWKDAGSPLREMKPEEEELFKQRIQAVYVQFFDAVKSGRLDAMKSRLADEGKDEADDAALERLHELAQGQVFLGDEALALGLIDEVGNFYDAVAEAKRLAGLPDDAPRVADENIMTKILESMGVPAAESPAGLANRLTAARMEYRYLPGGILE
ncbi:MAG: signal peptide peptidase SppA [Planctomycetes bacterium]|nr:signal peptide peptidase SppA [Planctomycetota bacterium]